jgi:hypothetical protein
MIAGCAGGSTATALREANMTATLGRQRWVEREQLEDRGRLRPDDAATPGYPVSGSPAGAAPLTPARVR